MRSVHNARAYVAASMAWWLCGLVALKFHCSPRNRSAGHEEPDIGVMLMMTAVIQSPLVIIIDD